MVAVTRYALIKPEQEKFIVIGIYLCFANVHSQDIKVVSMLIEQLNKENNFIFQQYRQLKIHSYVEKKVTVPESWFSGLI